MYCISFFSTFYCSHQSLSILKRYKVRIRKSWSCTDDAVGCYSDNLVNKGNGFVRNCVQAYTKFVSNYLAQLPYQSVLCMPALGSL